MNLEIKDRLILKNQYTILSEVHPHERDYYLRMVEVLERGYEAEYSDLISHFSQVFREDESSFVIDVLDMHTQFEWAKEQGVEIPSAHAFFFNFTGFDGNNELPYMSYAAFQINQEGHWDRLKGKDLNSHMPTIDRYVKMLTAWKQSADAHNLTTEDFVRIAEAITAPSIGRT